MDNLKHFGGFCYESWIILYDLIQTMILVMFIFKRPTKAGALYSRYVLYVVINSMPHYINRSLYKDILKFCYFVKPV